MILSQIISLDTKLIKRFSLPAKAIYYELCGEKRKALNIYADILKKDPNNKKAKISIRRLSGIYAKFSDINQEMLEKFNKIGNNKDLMEFEKWLLKI